MTATTKPRGPLAAGLVLALLLGGTMLIPGLRGRLHREGVPAVASRGAPRELLFHLRDGATWRLSDDRGEVVAVNLWATWCGPCRSETPMLAAMDQAYGKDGLRVLGVSLDTGAGRDEAVAAFVKAYGVRYPIAFPDAMSQMEAGLDGLPTTLLFDRAGRTARIYVGRLDEPTFRADVMTLLGEPRATR